MSYQIVMIRHGESEWNKKNLFTGWTDVDLSEKGHLEAAQGGKALKEECFTFDVCYTSVLKRAIHTANHVLEELDEEWIPVIKSYKLNERHYGALQGLNKAETAAKYGEQQVKIWRRSFDVQPPALTPEDDRNPALQKMYKNVDAKDLPLTESLKDTIARVIPYYEDVIKKDIVEGKKVLIAAHGNSLRALFKYLNHISDEDIINVNIPTGVPLVVELDENLEAVSYRYLGNQEEIQAKMDAVKNQGKK
ncbi:2,3-diphosphoglycerate-dependent phosphoglycerate mutase [Faecalicoccus pleomorphus]|uniref:2,3-diphosphoglycerate-dependent phosphoglycerate mutase n=1 Tax=Faecalicoccus pleomorphus TaxID=1323 RepID=UPI001897CFC1|nr:2,3-diphosphoglycerate-dependent phosphoglycerate mutase [Faecalicoccus pleomorphus]MDB7984913.1 2,3-diphosphoglycerate-dependent phosphoglycerate mutase [Faecalicoccus pleomorphus]MDB7989309.1 2,3-diphosphoglycerate-dependent phosphoglycerate mutase [Faecalicoccus pleomorphus]MDB7993632.1 2,3-diphosphoglycerate-dependent phosphoglycerate mutase [Faecalicoccus pleomorphus]